MIGRVFIILLVAILAGCARSPRQFDICKPTNLSPAELEDLKNCVAEAESTREEVVAERMRPWLEYEDVASDSRWIPFIYDRLFRTSIHSKPVKVERCFYASKPEIFDPGADKLLLRKDYDEQFGPSIYRHGTTQLYDSQGQPFASRMSARTFWGFLWLAEYHYDASPNFEEFYAAGPCLGVLGYSIARTSEARTISLHILFIPIPIRQVKLSQSSDDPANTDD